MAAEPIFDIRKSLVRRNIERMIILPVMAIGFILLGLWLIPDTFVWELSVDAIKSWNGWAFVGIILVGSGVVTLIKTVVFGYRSLASSGEWHFRLTNDELLWQVPDHQHGPETGFSSSVPNIKELEYRTISRHDEMDLRQHWIHFHDREPIQLHSYTGISVSWLVSEIHKAGVPYKETFGQK